MTRRKRRTSRTPFWAAVTVVAIVTVGIPTAVTSAYLTAQGNATANSAVGNWCAVPSTAKKNVYRLSDFTAVNAPEANGSTTASRMLVLPVVNNGSYTPIQAVTGATNGQLGVRLWSCTDPMSASNTIKLTSWRGTYNNNQSFNWTVAPSATTTFPEARLAAAGTITNSSTSASTVPGAELRDLHRNINKQGGQTGTNPDPVNMRYSWLLSSERSKGANYTADPTCATKTCLISTSGVSGFGNTFSGVDTAANSYAVSGNSATYLAEKYYSDGGVWPTTTSNYQQLQCSSRSRSWVFWPFLLGDWSDWSAWSDASSCPANATTLEYRSQYVTKTATTDNTPTAAPTVLQSAGSATIDSLLRDTTGTKVQWVVLEWWGTGVPPADLEIEVFVA